MNKSMLWYLLLVFSIGVLILSFAIRYRVHPSLPGSNIKKITNILINSRKADIGKVATSNAKADFILYNTGSENLYIDNVEVSCSCSSATVVNRAIAPGDSVPITVMYNKKIPGYFYSDVLIYGNFETSPEILSFEGYLVDR